MTKPPLDKGNFLFGHSIKFNNDALSLVKNLQQKHGDIFEISILHKRVTLFMTPSATKHIYLDTEDNLNPISVFDYEKNRNYRILISNKNQIKMYDSRGKIVSGFKPVKFDSNIKNSPVHIRIKGKD